MAKDIVVNAVTKYHADITDHVRKLEQLRKEEQKRNEELLNELKEQESRWNDMIGTIAKVTAGVAAIGGAIAIAKESYRAFAEDVKLRSGAAGADLDRLRQSTRGLVNDVELMRLAQSGLNSDFKLSQSQLETVSESLLLFRKRGFDARETSQALGDAIRESNVEPLKKLGIILSDDLVKLGIQNETYEAQQLILGELRKQIAGAGGDYAMAGDEMERAMVAADNATRDLKVAIGELVTALGPMIAKIAEAVSSLARMINQMRGVGLEAREANAQVRVAAATAMQDRPALRGLGIALTDIASASDGFLLPALNTETGRRMVRPGSLEDALTEQAGVALERQQQILNSAFQGAAQDHINRVTNEYLRATREALRKAKRSSRTGARAQGTFFKTDFLAAFRRIGQEGTSPFSGALGFLGEQSENVRGLGDLARGFLGDFGDATRGSVLGDIGSALTGDRDADRERARLEELDATLTRLTPAMDFAAGAAGAMFSALVTGSMSAGKAIKQFAGQWLLGEGTRLAGIALSSGVQGLFQLAIGDPRAAASFKASAAAAAGAVSLGAMARSLGVGGSIPGVGATGGRAIGAGAGAGVGQPQTQIIVLGDGFATGREAASKFANITERIDRTEGMVRAGGFS